MVTVRPATTQDVTAVLPFVGEICAYHERLDPARYPMLPDVVERYRRWLPERAVDPRSVFLVAEAGDAAIGFLVGSVEANIPIYRLAEFGFIHDLWVEPAHRGRGVARALAAAAVAGFAAMGVRQVRLETAVANDAARRVFRSVGFRAGAVEMLIDLPRG